MKENSEGNTPDRSAVRRWAKIRLWAGYVYLALAIAIAHPQLWTAMAGIVLIVIGAAIRLLASATLIKDRELCTDGIYSVTRHPLYLGSALVGLGFAALSSSIWVLAAFIIVLVPLYARMILIEEDFIRQLFPDSYYEYEERVPRFIPRIFPLPKFSGALDRERLVMSREIFSTVAFLLVAAIILLWHRSWLPG